MKKPIIITINSAKGGCQKTTTAQSLGAALHIKGYTCLLVDMDPQMNLIETTVPEDIETELNIYDLMTDFNNEKDVTKAVVHLEYYDILMGSSNINLFEEQYKTRMKSDERLSEVLANFGDTYDFILIDSNSMMGVLCNNTLACADFCIIPSDPDKASISGAMKFNSALETIKKYYKVRLLGILITRYDARTNISNDSLKMLLEAFPGITFKYGIPSTVMFQNARRFYYNIFQLDKSCPGAKAYELICDEMLERLSKLEEGI